MIDLILLDFDGLSHHGLLGIESFQLSGTVLLDARLEQLLVECDCVDMMVITNHGWYDGVL